MKMEDRCPHSRRQFHSCSCQMEWGVDRPKESHWNLARIDKRQGDIVNGVYRLSVWSHSKWIQWTLVCPSSIWTFIFLSFYFIFFPHFLFILLNFSSMEICLVWSIPFSSIEYIYMYILEILYMCILGREKMNEWKEPCRMARTLHILDWIWMYAWMNVREIWIVVVFIVVYACRPFISLI